MPECAIQVRREKTLVMLPSAGSCVLQYQPSQQDVTISTTAA